MYTLILALIGGAAAVAVASGMAAITYSILTVAEGGGRILTTHQLYGGTLDVLKTLFPNFNIKIDKVHNDASVEDFSKLIFPDTKAILVETISNPTSMVMDIEELSKLAHKNNIPLIVDNTLATPYLLNPINFGADIVIYSATKAISGHGSAIGGLIIDSGKFNWANGNFPQFTKKIFNLRDSNEIERSFVEAFPEFPFAGKVRRHYLGYFGAVLSPFDAYLILLGLETLSERMEKQILSTKKIIEFLKNQDMVSWISYPDLESSPYKNLVTKYLPKGAGSLFSFGFNGTQKQIYKFIESINLFGYQANLGDARSLLINSSKTTHGELTAEELKKAKITLETIRVSVGLEDVKDLINDLKQAFEKAKNI